jgi:hypothetical protein
MQKYNLESRPKNAPARALQTGTATRRKAYPCELTFASRLLRVPPLPFLKVRGTGRGVRLLAGISGLKAQEPNLLFPQHDHQVICQRQRTQGPLGQLIASLGRFEQGILLVGRGALQQRGALAV